MSPFSLLLNCHAMDGHGRRRFCHTTRYSWVPVQCLLQCTNYSSIIGKRGKSHSVKMTISKQHSRGFALLQHQIARQPAYLCLLAQIK